MSNDTTTQQEGRNPDGTFKKGYKPPTTFAGFRIVTGKQIGRAHV